MRRLYLLLGLLWILVLTGCQQENHESKIETPYLIGQKSQNLTTYAQNILENSTMPKTPDAKIRKMELKAQKEIEEIRAQKELAIAQLQAQVQQKRISSQESLTLKKIEAKLEEITGERKIMGWVLVLGALFLLLLLWVVVKLFREYHRYQERRQERQMAHETKMQVQEIQGKVVEKMFEALSSGHLSEEEKKRLLNVIGDFKDNSLLLDHSKKEL